MSDRIEDEMELYFAGLDCYAVLIALRVNDKTIPEAHHELADKAIARYDAAHKRRYPLKGAA